MEINKESIKNTINNNQIIQPKYMMNLLGNSYEIFLG